MPRKKPLDRRTFLRSTGTAIALPFLESMLPIGAAAQTITAPLRCAFVFFPLGTYRDSLETSGSGTNYSFPSTLQSLTPFKSMISHVHRGYNYWGQANGDGGGDHGRSQGTYLTASRANKSEVDIFNGISVDQYIAQNASLPTKVPSIYIENPGAIWADSGYGDAYTRISWTDPRNFNPGIQRPHRVYEILFGDGTVPASDDQVKLRLKKSILSEVLDDVNRLMANVSTSDKMKLDQYLTGIREVERGIDNQLNQTGVSNCNSGTKPPDSGYSFEQRTRYMIDLIALAFQCEATRVIPFMMGSTNFGFLGYGGNHHLDYSHHGGNPDGILRINKWYADMFAELLTKLNSIQDIDGNSILYNSMISFGTGMQDGDAHYDDYIPLYVAGAAGGKFTPGKRIDTGGQIPLANVWLSFIQAMGIQANSFGSGGGQSTGIVNL